MEMGIEPDRERIREGAGILNPENFSQFLTTSDSPVFKFLAYRVALYAAGDFSVKIPFELF